MKQFGEQALRPMHERAFGTPKVEATRIDCPCGQSLYTDDPDLAAEFLKTHTPHMKPEAPA